MDHMVLQIATALGRLERERWEAAVGRRGAPASRRGAIEPHEGLCTGEGVREAAVVLDADATQPTRVRLSLARQAALLHAELAAAQPVERLEAAQSVRVSAVGTRETSLARADMAIAAEQRPGARLQLWHAREGAVHALRGDLAARADRTAEALATVLHTDGASAAALLRGTTAAAARAVALEVLARTDDAWRAMGGWLLQRWVGVSFHEAREHDVACILGAPGLHRAFPAGGARNAAVGTLRELGLWPAPTHEEQMPADGAPYPLVAAVDPPHDVRLALPFRPADGPGAWSRTLAAATMAAALAAIDPDTTLGDRVTADVGAAGPGAALFSALIHDVPWRRRNASFPLTPDQSRELALAEIGALRIDAAALLGTLAVLEGGPTADAHEEAAQASRRAIGVDAGSWRWLERLDKGLDALAAFESASAATAWAERLRELFDEQWYRVPAAGEHLRRAFAGGGATDPAPLGATRGRAATVADPLLRALE